MGKERILKVIPKKIIIHHSRTKDNRAISWRAIRTFHTQAPEKKKKTRASGFIHIGKIIPGVLRDIKQKRPSEKRKEEEVS